MEPKQAIRERVWEALERAGVARFPPPRGRIPNFAGAQQAARRLTALPQWVAARVLKANPDAPQLAVRARALADGKLVYMAVPRLAAEAPFIALDPARLPSPPRAAASIRGAARFGRPARLQDLRPIDLVVCGSVAVNPEGVRIGKGGGYSDLELALCVESGLVSEQTLVATTVHDLQVLDEPLPEAAHDFRVDLIVTPATLIRPPRSKPRPGILWDHLDPAKVAAIPVLAARRAQLGP